MTDRTLAEVMLSLMRIGFDWNRFSLIGKDFPVLYRPAFAPIDTNRSKKKNHLMKAERRYVQLYRDALMPYQYCWYAEYIVFPETNEFSLQLTAVSVLLKLRVSIESPDDNSAACLFGNTPLNLTTLDTRDQPSKTN